MKKAILLRALLTLLGGGLLLAGCQSQKPAAPQPAASPAPAPAPAPIDVPTAIAQLRSGADLVTRARAAAALGASHDPRALAPLLAAAHDEQPSVRKAAFDALARLGDPKAIKALIAMLGDQELQEGARDALAKIGAPAVEPLIAALHSSALDVPANAAYTLGDIRDPRAIPALLPLLGDVETQFAAEYALARMGAPAVPGLLQALASRNATTRQMAAEALGEIGDPSGVEPLIAALQDKNQDVRLRAAGALAKSKDPRAMNALNQAWQSRDLVVVAGGCEFFIRRGTPGSEAVLVEALQKSGDMIVAESYLNSGNDKLRQAAEEWAQQHGMTVMPGFGGAPAGARWGAK